MGLHHLILVEPPVKGSSGPSTHSGESRRVFHKHGDCVVQNENAVHPGDVELLSLFPTVMQVSWS